MAKTKTGDVYTGKRKTAIARAVFEEGDGDITINGVPIEIHEPDIARMRIVNTLVLAKDHAKEYDIEVEVEGGGYMGQADAASIAIARGLADLAQTPEVEEIYKEYERSLLAGDPRRKESKKFGGPGARRKKQKSYR